MRRTRQPNQQVCKSSAKKDGEHTGGISSPVEEEKTPVFKRKPSFRFESEKPIFESPRRHQSKQLGSDKNNLAVAAYLILDKRSGSVDSKNRFNG